MPKLVCVKCQVELEIEKSGAVCCDMYNQPPKPYQLHMCDAWKCPGCGTVILAGFGNNSFSEHYEKDFQAVMEQAQVSSGEWFIKNYERVGDKNKDENGS